MCETTSGRQSSRWSPALRWLSCSLLALLLITPPLMLSAQPFEQNSRLSLIAELASIERELAQLRQRQIDSVAELSNSRQNSLDLSRRLDAALQRAEISQRLSSEASALASGLQTELDQLKTEYDACEKAWSTERRELSGQIEQVTSERNAQRARVARQRWLGRLEGAGSGALVAVIVIAILSVR